VLCTDHLWTGDLDKEILVELEAPLYVKKLRMVFDSDLNRATWDDQKWYIKMYPAVCNRFLDDKPVKVPKTLLRAYDVYADNGEGEWKLIHREENNYQRLVYVPIHEKVKRLKFVPKETWGAENVRIFSMELK
jgi:hypothetical protein